MAYAFNPFTGKLDLVGAGAAQVNSDWNATSGVAQILNKPTIPSPTTDASLLTSGTLADARLSSNVSLDNINNNFTAGQTITAPANTSALTASYSVTGANTTPLLDLSGTWNTTGVARGIRLNITDTASNPFSLLMDLQTNGISRLTIDKSGRLQPNSLTLGGWTTLNSSGQINIGTGGFLGFTIGTGDQTVDTIIRRDAANTLALRNGGTAGTPAPNAFRVYNYTDSGLTNFERGFMRWNSNVLEIGTEAGGTGTVRNVSILNQLTVNSIIWSSDSFRLTSGDIHIRGNTGVCVGSTTRIGFSSGASNSNAGPDTSFSRNAAGVVEVNNGTAGTFRDLRVRNVIQASGVATTVTPASNGDLVIEQTANTTLTFKMRGTDGTVRSATLTLA